jgi:hypothetical protein
MDQVNLHNEGESSPVNKGRPEPIPPGGIQFLGNARGTPEDSLRNQVLHDLEGALDVVDFYATKLADRSLSARDLEGLVGQLESQVEGLRSLASAPGLHEGLKNLLSETTLTIGTEVAKFRRGDYQ